MRSIGGCKQIGREESVWWWRENKSKHVLRLLYRFHLEAFEPSISSIFIYEPHSSTSSTTPHFKLSSFVSRVHQTSRVCKTSLPIGSFRCHASNRICRGLWTTLKLCGDYFMSTQSMTTDVIKRCTSHAELSPSAEEWDEQGEDDKQAIDKSPPQGNFKTRSKLKRGGASQALIVYGRHRLKSFKLFIQPALLIVERQRSQVEGR